MARQVWVMLEHADWFVEGVLKILQADLEKIARMTLPSFGRSTRVESSENRIRGKRFCYQSVGPEFVVCKLRARLQAWLGWRKRECRACPPLMS
jgi:hypothetical protein